MMWYKHRLRFGPIRRCGSCRVHHPVVGFDLGVEYQHVEFDTKFHPDISVTPSTSNDRNVSATVDSIRAKFTFKY